MAGAHYYPDDQNYKPRRLDDDSQQHECRNSSILAHGMKPIDEAIYRKEGQEGLILCREALAAIPASERKGRKVQQLPRKLPFETGGNK